MTKFINCLLCLAVVMAMACHAQAGHGLLRLGGCSDTCGSGSRAFGYAGGATASCATCNQVASYPSSVSSHSPAPAYSAPQVVTSPVEQGVAPCTQCAAAYAAGAAAQTMAGSTELVDCGPVASYQVVMEPQYFTETQARSTTQYQDEIRYRTRSIARQVPVEVQDYRTTTVMVPTTETKTIEYSVLVPVKSEKTVELTESVPVWNDVSTSYTVRVPTVVDVPEEYTVRVARLRDETFTYTVYVPQTHNETKLQTVTNAVPVTRMRTIQVCRPVTRMQTVTKDYGHWEVRMEEVAGLAAAPAISCGTPAVSTGGCGMNMGGCGNYTSSCGSCGGCGQVFAATAGGCQVSSTCGGCQGYGLTGANPVCATPAASTAAAACAPTSQLVSRRVWVPNVVTEEVPVTENLTSSEQVAYTAFETQTEQVPYECTYVVYVPEQRTGTRQAVDYVNETRTRTRKVVQYNEEVRTRTHRELSYTQQTRTETIPYVSYKTEKKTKEVTFTINVPQSKTEPFTTTRYDTVMEEVTEEYTVRVPVASTTEVQVQVCRMVPKLVPITIFPCSNAASGMIASACYSGSPSVGCVDCAGAPTLAPALDGCTSCGQPACNSCAP